MTRRVAQYAAFVDVLGLRMRLPLHACDRASPEWSAVAVELKMRETGTKASVMYRQLASVWALRSGYSTSWQSAAASRLFKA